MGGKYKVLSLLVLLSVVLILTGCESRMGDSALLQDEIEEITKYAFVLEFGGDKPVSEDILESLTKIEKTNGLESSVVLDQINNLELEAGEDDDLLLYDDVMNDKLWTLINADGDVDEVSAAEVGSKLNTIVHGDGNVLIVLVAGDDQDDVVDIRTHVKNNYREIGSLMDRDNIYVVVTR